MYYSLKGFNNYSSEFSPLECFHSYHGTYCEVFVVVVEMFLVPVEVSWKCFQLLVVLEVFLKLEVLSKCF